MSEVLAALLWSQLELRNDIQARRMEICALYQDYRQPLISAGLIRIPVSRVETGHGHLSCILVMKLSHRQPLRLHLKRVGFASAPHYLPLHSSPAGRASGRYITSLDVASRVAGQLFRFPLFADMSDEQVRCVTDAVTQYLITCEEGRLERR